MPRPRKSTTDAFVDQFASFDLTTQEKALELMQFEHRQAQRRAAKSKPEPAAQLDLREPQA